MSSSSGFTCKNIHCIDDTCTVDFIQIHDEYTINICQFSSKQYQQEIVLHLW